MLLQPFTGQTIKLSCAFADANGAAVDPAEVRFVVTDPAGTATTYLLSTDGVTQDAAGSYSVTVTPDAAGKWKVVATGDDTDDAVDADYVYVLPTP